MWAAGRLLAPAAPSLLTEPLPRRHLQAFNVLNNKRKPRPRPPPPPPQAETNGTDAGGKEQQAEQPEAGGKEGSGGKEDAGDHDELRRRQL